jgi:hypothetical protein
MGEGDTLSFTGKFTPPSCQARRGAIAQRPAPALNEAFPKGVELATHISLVINEIYHPPPRRRRTGPCAPPPSSPRA